MNAINMDEFHTYFAIFTIMSNFRHISSSLNTLESIPPKPHWGLRAR